MNISAEKISYAASKLQRDTHDINRFVIAFDAEHESAKAKHARSFLYQWLMLHRLRDALEIPAFDSAAVAVTSQIWPREIVSRAVTLSEFIGDAGELNRVWMQLSSELLVIEPEIGIDPVSAPHRFIAAREAKMAATSVQLLHLLPMLSKTRFEKYSEAWKNAAENGKVNPLSFGVLVRTLLYIQIHGADKAVGHWPAVDIESVAYVAEIVSLAFSEVDAALAS